MLEQMFALRARGATVGTEVLAGATTFIVVGYLMCGIMREIPFRNWSKIRSRFHANSGTAR
jgi:xanthine/uracil/vitamin C permease (AzgA family)